MIGTTRSSMSPSAVASEAWGDCLAQWKLTSPCSENSPSRRRCHSHRRAPAPGSSGCQAARASRAQLVVEPEPEDVEITDAAREAAAERAKDAGVPDGALNELKITGTTDASVVSFLARVAREPSQVLRYDRGGKPLWHGSNGRCDPATLPKCKCGARREFEFQVMPQLLHFFQMDSDALDFATIAVYSCPNSCAGSAREVAHLQPPYAEPPAAAS